MAPPTLLAVGTGAGPARPAGEPTSLAQLEQRAIHEMLERTGGNRSEAARRLGISRRKLVYRLKDYRDTGGATPLA